MVITENIGEGLIRSRSDCGMYIERDKVLYIEAVDPADSGRQYEETKIKIEGM